MEASNVRTLARPTPNRLVLRVCLCLSSMALVRGQATIGARNQASSGSGTFVTSRAAVTDLVGDVPQDTRVQLEQQDQQLDDISDAMDDLLAMSRAMGGELDRQTKQRMFRAGASASYSCLLVFTRVCPHQCAAVDDANFTLQKANQKAHKNTYRVNRMIPS